MTVDKKNTNLYKLNNEQRDRLVSILKHSTLKEGDILDIGEFSFKVEGATYIKKDEAEDEKAV